MFKGSDSTNTMNGVQLVDQIMLYSSMRTICWLGSLNLCQTYFKHCAHYKWIENFAAKCKCLEQGRIESFCQPQIWIDKSSKMAKIKHEKA